MFDIFTKFLFETNIRLRGQDLYILYRFMVNSFMVPGKLVKVFGLRLCVYKTVIINAYRWVWGGGS